ncbi:MAG: hypothetical protein ACFC03_01500 [Candidatus Malihini olakiniferum]
MVLKTTIVTSIKDFALGISVQETRWLIGIIYLASCAGKIRSEWSLMEESRRIVGFKRKRSAKHSIMLPTYQKSSGWAKSAFDR